MEIAPATPDLDPEHQRLWKTTKSHKKSGD